MQAQVDMQTAIINKQTASNNEIRSKEAKLQALRMAKEIVMENRKSSVDADAPITAQEILDIAETLSDYVNS